MKMPNNLSVSEKNQIDVAATEALLTGNVEKIFEAVASIKQKVIEEERERISNKIREFMEGNVMVSQPSVEKKALMVNWHMVKAALSNQQSHE